MQKGIIYHLLKNPVAQNKLRAEIDAADLSFPASFAETRDLPYLDAVIKEGLRMHPPIGNILERVVPSPGLTLRDGRVIAPGTIVGMNQWVVSRAKEVYGDDSDVFRPERWLREENETILAYKARLKMMKEGDLVFGGGNRICTGRHMAAIEMFKVTATLFSRYDVSDMTPAICESSNSSGMCNFMLNYSIDGARGPQHGLDASSMVVHFYRRHTSENNSTSTVICIRHNPRVPRQVLLRSSGVKDDKEETKQEERGIQRSPFRKRQREEKVTNVEDKEEQKRRVPEK